MRINEEELL
ncbi:Protein of unknown function [Streptococcus thermophilus]|nr:Protein of unknown function [Streptococcus thermophilus]